MRIWFFSDFHLEHNKIPEKEILAHGIPEADVCVVPGDMHKGEYAMAVLAQLVAPHMPVVYVPGNHDFYHEDMKQERARMADPMFREAGVYLLDPGVAVFGDLRVIGATLWTDYALLGEGNRERAMREAAVTINDHNLIARGERTGDGYEVWMPRHALKRHEEELAYIAARLEEPFDGTTVVVTHHGPHPDSVHPRFRGESFELMNGAFVSDLGDFILRHQPDMWLHGHIHDGVRYKVGKTEVVANPRGYQVVNKLIPSSTYGRGKDGRLFDAVSGFPVQEPYTGPENRIFNPLLVLETGPVPRDNPDVVP